MELKLTEEQLNQLRAEKKRIEDKKNQSVLEEDTWDLINYDEMIYSLSDIIERGSIENIHDLAY